MEEINVRSYVGGKIFQYRQSMHWTQRELSNKVGVAHNTVASWEKGTREPTMQQLYKIAVIFGISVSDLLPHTVTNMKLQKMEKELIRDFRNLNSAGQTIAASAVKGLAHTEEYRKN